MRRPHPYLAISLACAAVVLVTISALACPAAAQRVPPSVVYGVTETVNGWPVMRGSNECPPLGPTRYVPTKARIDEIHYRVYQALRYDLDHALLTPQIDRAAAVRMLDYLPYPRWSDRPVYGSWTAAGVPYVGCAQSIAWKTGPVISADDSYRSERLVAWERINVFLQFIGREDLCDSAYVSTIVQAVGPQVGGWKTQ